MDHCGQKVHLHKDLLEVKIEMSCRSCSRSFWSVCMLYVKEEEDTYYLADDDRVAEESHTLQPGSQSLLVAAAGVAALLQWARPGATACGEQPLFLLAGWVESACGDVLGASGQDIVSRAVYSEAEVWKKKSISPCSPSCTHKELFFFQNAQHVQHKQVPCVCTFRWWLWVTNLGSTVIFLWNHTCYTSSCCKDFAEVYSGHM